MNSKFNIKEPFALYRLFHMNSVYSLQFLCQCIWIEITFSVEKRAEKPIRFDGWLACGSSFFKFREFIKLKIGLNGKNTMCVSTFRWAACFEIYLILIDFLNVESISKNWMRSQVYSKGSNFNSDCDVYRFMWNSKSNKNFNIHLRHGETKHPKQKWI